MSAGGATQARRGRKPPSQLQAAKECQTNQTRNLDFCKCTYEPCGNKGVCCNCIRNHFAAGGTGRVACMK